MFIKNIDNYFSFLSVWLAAIIKFIVSKFPYEYANIAKLTKQNISLLINGLSTEGNIYINIKMTEIILFLNKTYYTIKLSLVF